MIVPTAGARRTGELEDTMFAIAAAVIFGLALLLDFADANLGDAFTATTLTIAGLLCLSLHLAGVGTTVRGRSYSRG